MKWIIGLCLCWSALAATTEEMQAIANANETLKNCSVTLYINQKRRADAIEGGETALPKLYKALIETKRNPKGTTDGMPNNRYQQALEARMYSLIQWAGSEQGNKVVNADFVDAKKKFEKAKAALQDSQIADDIKAWVKVAEDALAEAK